MDEYVGLIRSNDDPKNEYLNPMVKRLLKDTGAYAWRYKRGLGLLCLNVLIAGLLVRGCYNRPKVGLAPITAHIALNQPTDIDWHPQLPHVMFVSQKVGLITWVDLNSEEHGTSLDLSNVVLASTPEEGLLSLTFDPNFETNRFVYAFYSLPEPMRSRVARFTLNEDHSVAPASELVIIELEKVHNNHNGGMLAFGSDGYLYASFGDSFITKRSVADELLQNRTTLYGTVVRLDVSQANEERPYRIPPDNPFVHEEGVRGEIWAYGLRNPWRFSFDEDGESLLVGDVGGNRWEEINRISKGGQHYGWPIMEGEGCRYSSDHGNCDRANKELPVGSFYHDKFVAINGGMIYRGKAIEHLQGQYVFSDYRSGVFSFSLPTSGTVNRATPQALYPLIQQGPNQGRQMFLSSSAEGPDGEHYFTALNDGVYKMVPLDLVDQWKGFLYEALRF